MLKLGIAILILIFAATSALYHSTQKADINYFQGHQLFKNGKYREATGYFKKSLALKPDKIKVHEELAYSYQWSKQYPEAIEFFRKIAAVNPKNFKVKKSLAQTYSWIKDYPAAISTYEELIKDTNDMEVRVELAEIYLWNKQYALAEKLLAEALAKDAKNLKARITLAKLFHYSGRYAQAIAIYSELLSVRGLKIEDEKELIQLFGEAAMITKEYGTSVVLYKNILKNNSQDVKTRIRLADILSWTGNYTESIAEYLIALKQDAENLELKKKLAAVYIWSKDYASAKKNLTQALEKNPDDWESKVNLSDTYAYSKEFKKAIRLYEEALKKSDKVEVRVKLADVLSWDRQYERALSLYDAALAVKEDTKVRVQKARVLGWAKQYVKSLAEYRRILDIHYDPLIQLELSAKRAYWDGRVKEAIKNYSVLIEHDPRNAEAIFDLTQVYSYQSMWEDARTQYDRILEAYPEHFRAREGREKVNLISGHQSLKFGCEFLEQDSSSRDMDLKKSSYYSLLNSPLNDKLNVGMEYRFNRRSFSDFGDVRENEERLRFTYLKKPSWWADAFYNLTKYSRGIKHTHTFGSSLNVRALDVGVFSFTQERRRLENNSTVLRNRLYSDNFQERLSLDVNKKFKVGLDYLFASYSDDNSQHAPGLDILYFFSIDPRRLSLKYRYFYQNFARKQSDYFSPKGFSTNSLFLNWRHFLNKEEIFFGANDLYYDLGYAASVDSRNIASHKFSAEFNWDVNKRLNFNIRAAVTRSSVNIYNDKNINMSIKYYF